MKYFLIYSTHAQRCALVGGGEENILVNESIFYVPRVKKNSQNVFVVVCVYFFLILVVDFSKRGSFFGVVVPTSAEKIRHTGLAICR